MNTTDNSSLEMTLNSALMQKQHLKIDSAGITLNNRFLPFSEITGIRYGAENVNAYGVHARKNFYIDLNAPKKMQIRLTASSLKKGAITNADEQFNQITDCLWKNYTSKVVNGMIEKLNKGEAVRVGNFEVNRNGIKVFYTKFLFSKKESLIPFADCLKGLGPGFLFVKSSKDKKIKGQSMFLGTWDLNALHSLLNYLWDNGRCFSPEKGEKI